MQTHPKTRRPLTAADDPSPLADVYTERQFRRLVPMSHSTFWREINTTRQLAIVNFGRRVFVTRTEKDRYVRERMQPAARP